MIFIIVVIMIMSMINDHDDHQTQLDLYGALIKCKFLDRLRPRVKRTSACGTHVFNQYWRIVMMMVMLMTLVMMKEEEEKG